MSTEEAAKFASTVNWTSTALPHLERLEQAGYVPMQPFPARG